MEKSMGEHEREIKDIIRRAKGNPDKTGTLRRETLRRLIDLTHSPHPHLKILAAGGIRYFFNDFPEYEEAAINAVYDLCEDQSAKVRIEGYTAITQVSKAQNKWVKRNADVLLQLLQSDEPDEVIVVKKALTEHLDMDPRITLGVLCDQIVPPNDPMDEEEQFTRDRVRSLVLSFLTGEAKRAIVERHASPGSDAEDVLVNGILTAIPKLEYKDTELVVKDLLLSLPSYKPHSPRGHALLLVLLEQASVSLRKDIRPGKPASLETTRHYLDLAAFVVIEKRIAPPIDLLRFYYTSLAGKMTLQRLSIDDQTWVICSMAETLAACDQDPKNHDGPQLSALRRQVIDACPILFERLCKSGLLHSRSRNSCKILLQSCLRRKDESGWTVPPHLASALREIQALQGIDQVEDIQSLIRSLVPPMTKPTPHQDADPSSGVSTSNIIPKLATKQNDHGRHLSLPERPPPINAPSRRMVIPTKPRDRDQIMRDTPLVPPERTASIPSTPSTSKHIIGVDDSLRPSKKQKKGGVGGADIGLSLLSRMESSASNGPSHRPDIALSAKRTSDVVHGSLAAVIDQPPLGGYSIKGAAKNSPNVETSLQTLVAPPTSLLNRLHDGAGLSSTVDDRVTGRKKKKRGKAV